MSPDLLARLRCPRCRGRLDAALRCGACAVDYPVVRGIPRFVDARNYAASFGDQWNRFRPEQLDSHTGTRFSRDRFCEVTGWNLPDLKDRWVLDGGCGAGRFAEIALEAGAHVVAVDVSRAADACATNLAARFPGRLHVVQASIYELPFETASFDFVYCIGVIQHTPDPAGAMRALARAVRPGGRLAMWMYELTWKSFVGHSAWKYGLRTFTRRMSADANYAFASMLTALLWPVWRPLMSLGAPGRALLAALPVAARHYAGKGLSPQHVYRCVLLDTMDMYSPAYDSPQTYGRVVRLLEREGIRDLRRTGVGLGIEGRRA